MTDPLALLAEAAEALRDPAFDYIRREALSWKIRDALGEPVATLHEWSMNGTCAACGCWRARSPGRQWHYWLMDEYVSHAEPPCDRRLVPK